MESGPSAEYRHGAKAEPMKTTVKAMERTAKPEAAGQVQLSVVIPAYNASAFIAECLQSVLAQDDCPAFEVIVVDDGSSDGTYALIEKSFPQVRLFRKTNGGPGSARNYGVEKACGEVIVFTDADDIMLSGRLSSQGAFMLRNPIIGLSVGNLKYQLNPLYDGMLTRGVCESQEFQKIKSSYERLLVYENFIGTSVTAVRKTAYLEVGGQPEDIWVGEDYAMWCAIARRWPIAATRRYLTWYRQSHGNNLMASKHTYRGPVLVLRDQLLANGQLLTQEQYRNAFKRWCHLANMLLRWVWAESGRGAVITEAAALQPLLPRWLYVKWLILSFIPPALGRAARHSKRLAYMFNSNRKLLK